MVGRVENFVDELPKAISEVEKLLTRNRIFLDRTEGIGEISKEDALAYGLTGPNLRASGVDLDLAKG
jgi:NADH-quinone oxidoreductase subunit D